MVARLVANVGQVPCLLRSDAIVTDIESLQVRSSQLLRYW